MIRSGTEYMDYKTSPNYTLSSGSGPRLYDSYVLFKQPFPVTPEITICIYAFDTAHNNNVRITCSAKDITPYGFTIRAETWGDSCIYSIGMRWIAYVN